MQIAVARMEAKDFLQKNLIESRARRPNPDQKFMVRWPKGNGTLLLADEPDVLAEKLAKRMQADARRNTKH